jgi:hypothetical protein
VLQFHWRLSTFRAGLEPEDLRRHIAVFGGTEEKPGDLGIGFGLTERECHKGAGLFVQIVASVQNDGT